MSRGLGNMEGYRIPAIPDRRPRRRAMEVRPALDSEALNAGDPTGAVYLATAVPLMCPTMPARLSAAARRRFERQYATIEIADSVALMAGHQVARRAGYPVRSRAPFRPSKGTS